jgi:thiol:disulfide interchange protein DsbD
MYHRTLLALLAICALPLRANAQEPTESFSPFGLEVRPGLASARPGDELPIAVVLAIADHHKVYEETVQISSGNERTTRIVSVDRPLPVDAYDEFSGETRRVYLGDATFVVTVILPGELEPEAKNLSASLVVRFQGCSGSICFLPETRAVDLSVPLRAPTTTPLRINAEYFTAPTGSPTETDADDFTQRSPLMAILFAFGFGLLLSFTPCVYPLVPVTVAVIGARSASGGWKRGFALSLVYVFGLSVTYAMLGVAAATGGSSIGAASRHWAAITLIAVLFLLLAVSMFGVYDLELPAKWQSKLRGRKAGGVVGVLIMGALSGLVATPCVAAPLASVLVFIARTGSVAFGAAMLFAMAWGMGALLILAGTFSGLTGKLPKAGGWMVAVKTGMGVILLVAAAYFARPLVPTALFTPWVALPLVALGLWRGVLVRVNVGAPRGTLAIRALGIIALTYGAYAGLGALARAGVPLPLVASILPDEVLQSHSKIDFRTDYEAAMRDASASSRPVMIDFVLPNCAGCRQLEANVFADDAVAEEAKRFVTVRIDLAAPPVPIETLKAAYGIFGAPSVVWVESGGAIRHDLAIADGETSAEEFLRRMRDVK